VNKLQSQLRVDQSSQRGIGLATEPALRLTHPHLQGTTGLIPLENSLDRLHQPVGLETREPVALETRESPPGPSGAEEWHEVGKKVEAHEKTISVLQEEIHK